MPKIVGEFELSSIKRSFMKDDGEFNSGGENKGGGGGASPCYM